MGCVLNSGVLRDCGHSFGGIKELWLGNFADIEEMEYDANGQVTGATLVSGATIYEFQFVKDTGQALEELQKEGASSFINQTLNFQLNNITMDKKKVLSDLSLSTIFAIVKKVDNQYWFYGEQAKSAGLEATELSIDTGTAQTDAAGATIALVGASLDYASVITDNAVVSLLAE